MTSFWRQTYYLLYRNLLLKRRNLKQLLEEVLLPCIFIIAIVIFQTFAYKDTYGRIEYANFTNYKLLDGAYHGSGYFLPDNYIPWSFTPNTTVTRDVMDMVVATFGDKAPNAGLLAYDSEEDMVTAFNNRLIALGVVFSNNFPQNLTVVIRMNQLPYSKEGFISPAACRSEGNDVGAVYCEANSYLFSGFAALQVVIQNAVASVLTNETLPVPGFSVRMFPKDKYVLESTPYTRILSVVYYVMMYAAFIGVLLTNLVYEKEKKIKEVLLMMGMSDGAFWFAWFIIYGVILFVVSLVVTLLSKFALQSVPNGNVLIIFFILFFYGMSLVSLSFMLTPFFNKALVAGAVATIATIVLGLVYIPIGFFPGFDNVFRWLLSFFSPIAVALAMDQAIFLDIEGSGIQFDNCGLGGFPPYVAMLAIDTVLYLLLAVYFDNVIPGNYGQHHPPWFCFMPSYWRRRPGTSVTVGDLEIAEFDGQNDVELVSPEMRASAGIRIRSLAKSFPGGSGKPDIRAVKGMTLDIYEGQITCLLGHNGAGKTTLINTLTGLIPADSGQATIYGYSIRDPIQMQKIRSMMGVCSQDNTLFDILSPREHLRVYAGLKGVPPKDIDAEVESVLKQTLLDESADTKSKDLSGGQKRKLCVGIALIGDPKILFLDEPSSGMDPYSRRQLWSLLKNQRQGRIMVLTTHFMDEADILADRKAVMSRGSLRCYGSSLFLKSRFGVGYHLGMVVDQDAHVDSITDLVTTHIPNGQVSRSHGMELAYTLPLREADRFPGLFQALEETARNQACTVAKQLGIQSYGVSMTTLEEVFLRLNDDEDGDDDEEGEMAAVKSDTAPLDNAECSRKNNGLESMSLDVADLITQPLHPGSNQIKALCTVQFLQMLRNPKTYFFRLLIPVVFMVAAAILIATVSFDFVLGGDLGPFILDPKIYLKSNSDTPLRMLTPLLYLSNLTGGEDIELLVEQFKRMELISSGDIDDMSQLMSVAPHSMATVVTNLGTSGTPDFLALYNDTAVHSLPILLNVLSNALVPLQTSSKTVLDMTFASHAFPESESRVFVLNNGIFLVVCLSIAMTLLPIGFMTNVVKERQDKVRTQLRVSGVTATSYWISHFMIDSAQMCLIVIIAIIISVITGFSTSGTSLVTGGGMCTFIIFMIIYVPLEVLFSYCLSFLFKEYKTCQSVAQILYIFLPLLLLAPTVLTELLDKPSAPGPDGQPSPKVDNPVPQTLHLIFSFFYPPYAVFGALYYIDKIYQEAYISETVDKLSFGDYFAFDKVIVPSILCVLGSLIVVLFLLRLLEIFSTGGNWKDVFMISKKEDTVYPNDDIIDYEDSDVKTEREKVRRVFDQDINRAERCVMAVSNIRKVFNRTNCCCCCRKKTSKVAVRNLSLRVNQGEVMGLLGPNGAGKTTSMNVITADTKATRGQIQIAGYDIHSSLSDALREMGYCPQHDPLYENITVREHLEAYALIKGIHPDNTKAISEHYMDAVNIMEHANKKAQQLSGGTKRKLCFAISMLGKPKIVFLDEPSTGMDPSSKRFIWNTIIASFHDDQGAILTTHSMEEADAVCSRVGIMVSGKLMCLGTTQHLKSKYGGGYSLEVKLNPGPAYYSMDHTSGQATQLLEQLQAKLDGMIRSMFPGAEVVEKFGERVTYKILRENVGSLSTVFAALEQGKDTLQIEEYSFSQASLEQVFLQFAKMQSDKGDEEKFQSSRHPASPLNSQYTLGEPV